MKIGIFTDTYRPSVNGIVAVVDILRRQFEDSGHQVYIFAPGDGLRVDKDDTHVMWFPAVKGYLFDEFSTALFFPPAVLKEIKQIDLDVCHFLTPGPVGLMGVYASHILKKPLIAEYCTDLFEYVEHYPAALPALIAGAMVLPFTIKVSPEDLLEILSISRPHRSLTQWNRTMVKDLVTILHARCDAVVVHSRKSAEQLKGWQYDEYTYAAHLIPTGVDPLPVPSHDELLAFQKTHGITPADEVITYVGRLSAEKNLAMLIDMIVALQHKRPHAKLMYVGDFDYRPVLEEKAAASPAADKIIFTGRMPRQKLGLAFASSRVFAFPSLTDTQGLVLHEAALAGLPLVACDKKVSEVLHNGKNGLYCRDDPKDMANKIASILQHTDQQKSMGKASQEIAAHYSETSQARKIITLYERSIEKRLHADSH